jgi:3-isopropylmalate dehydrogenase
MAAKSNHYQIVLLSGDGIGPEILAEAVKVLKALELKFDFHFDFIEAPIGGASIDHSGVPLTDETIRLCKGSSAVLLGAVGGPKWDHHAKENRPETGLLSLRKALGLYCNLRPVKLFSSLKEASPLKQNDQNDLLDLLIVRELTGGIYFGERGTKNTPLGVTAWDQECYTDYEIERIAHIAFEVAKLRKGKVTSIDKANVLESSILWRKTVEETWAGQHESVELGHQYVDNCAMQLILNPHQFDVILTSNLFGDILSDEASTLAGSIGLMPSASLGDF